MFSTTVVRRWGMTLAGVGLAAATLTTTAFAQESSAPAVSSSTNAIVPPASVKLKLKAFGGTGCTKKTTAVRMNAAKTAMYVRYGKYTAQVGPKAPAAEARRFCQFVVSLQVPQGFSYAVTAVDHHGYGQLATDTKGYLESALYFAGSPATVGNVTQVKLSRAHTFSAHRAITKLTWSDCHTTADLTIKSALRVQRAPSARTTRSYLTMDTSKVTESTLLQLRWKRC